MIIKKISSFEKLKSFFYGLVNYTLFINGITILIPPKYYMIKLPIFFICIIFSTIALILSIIDKLTK